MKRNQDLPELLAPAGSFDALVAAVLAGADAVYIGGLRFGARAYAKNFDEEELLRAVGLCHMFGTRIYVTLNTLIFDKEADDAVAYAESLYRMGVDALIVADVRIAARIRREVPNLELHASTQMGVHNTAGADFAYQLGCKRVVLARECQFEDIKKVTASAKAECEVFVHGALCVCHSGQCLFSSLVGGRSGNRGECAQPCRLPYDKNKHVLSLSDLSLSNHINELIESGVSSLKIEGRMKSPSYVYEVTRIYRTLLDEHRCASAAENKRLSTVFSRGGFTDAYFRGKTFEKMTGMRTEEDKAESKSNEIASFALPKLKIRAKAEFRLGECARLTLIASAISRWDRTDRQISVEAKGAVPVKAENSPLTAEGVKERLSKMGNTPFELSPSDVELSLDEGINLPPSAINALRRDAAELLSKKYLTKLEELCFLNVAPLPSLEFSYTGKKCEKDKKKTTALFFKTESFEALLGGFDIKSHIDTVFVPLFKYSSLSAEAKSAVGGVYLPPIIMEHEWDAVKSEVMRVRENKSLTLLSGNISHIVMAKELSAPFVCDFRMNVTNSLSYSLYNSLGALDIILSPEVTLPQARDIGGGIITLGRVPLMITERCFMKENYGCERCSAVSLCDRKGARFPMMREYEHRNIIFNSSPTYMGDKESEIARAGISHRHFIFSSESGGEIKSLVCSYKKGLPLDMPHRRIGKR